ncbi:TetR/AcrR family transcriptional regulator [Chitinimonas koreensis]|uniref:TetR/AcrR family transcriptional regulator n=1 Tax=Chitinimonas koreensis TaxID=356302 RepID=UPI00040C81B7|nr:TetR/AcrR family transcriptional regulator [Chitinimonas koreensis]QNM98023.1 TetR/AcrR family transcriptional regulator [Chitinimonas koreensis]
MPKDAGPQRQRLIETAARLFEAQGYAATGLQQLLAESGAPKGSLYHYFPGGKEALAVAVVEHAAAAIESGLAQALAAATPQDGLLAALALFRRKLVEADFRAGCPIATIALEQSDASEPIRLACERAYAGWQARLAAALGGDAAAARQAERLLARLEGALLLARVRRSTAPLDALADDLALDSTTRHIANGDGR